MSWEFWAGGGGDDSTHIPPHSQDIIREISLYKRDFTQIKKNFGGF